MNKYIKVLSLLLALTSSVYLPSAFAATTTSSTDMLITIAETNPDLIERLDDIAITNPELLNQLLTMADGDAEQLERLLNLAESNYYIFSKLASIKSVETTQEVKVEEEQVSPYGQMSTFGAIDVGDVIQN
ncbi:hypothetical protein CXF85_00625 [Colwellia sp. 75C3]|uniref:hypothetical protein n=1 Tax=Colwellia sp. 75C3 TaxID=888425 RepID=UPI000C321EF9|nr:hypothetical protein [Colwellia sp. 75C3]PKG86250.1 hypothetical protein CXF85_00625 [Colwellia sp. 75C3]